MFEDGDKTPAAPFNVVAMQRKLEEQSQIILVLGVALVFAALVCTALAIATFGDDSAPEAASGGATCIKACADWSDELTCSTTCMPGAMEIKMFTGAR
jgi:hypothetical protein